jgi:hypothetical protein
VNEVVDEGFKEVTWDGTDAFGNSVYSGVYFYRVVSENSIALQRNHLPHVRHTGGMRSAVSIVLSDSTRIVSDEFACRRSKEKQTGCRVSVSSRSAKLRAPMVTEYL